MLYNIILLLQAISLILFNLTFLPKKKNINNLYITGILVNITAYIFFLSTLSLDFSDDLWEYNYNYESLNHLTSLKDIDPTDKGYFFSIYLYLFTFFNFRTFLVFTGLLSLLIPISLNGIIKKLQINKTQTLFLFCSTIFFNRFYIGFSTNIIRSFLASIFIQLAILKGPTILKVFKNLLALGIHQAQSLLGILITQIGIRLVSRKLSILLFLVSLLLLLTKVHITLGTEFLKIVESTTEFKVSSLIKSTNYGTSYWLQVLIFVVLPCTILLNNKTNKIGNGRMGYMVIFITALFLILVDITPRADRILCTIFLLLNTLAILHLQRFYSKRILWLYTNFIMIFNIIGLYMNKGLVQFL